MKVMTRTKLRVCPHCVVEDIAESGVLGVHRRCFWQFYAIRTCKRHNAPLLQLPAEKHTIRNFDVVGLVEKHYDLICREASKSVVRKFTPFEAYLQKRLTNPRRILFLDGFRMHIAAKLCETLGATMLFDRTQKMRDFSDDELHEAGRLGFEATKDKATFRKALADLWNHGDGQARHKSDLGHLYSWLTREPEHPDNSALKDFVSDLVFATYPVRPGATVFKRPCPRSVKFSITTASEEFGIPSQRLARMARHAGIAKKCRKTNRVILKEPLTRQKINGFLKSADRYLTATNARKYLGLSDPFFDSLLHYGVLKKSKNPIDPSRCFHHGKLGWLVRDVRGKTMTSSDANQELFEFEDLPSKANIPPAEVVHAIIHGRLKHAVLPDTSHGLEELQIDKREYDAFLDCREVSSVLSLTEVATELCTPHTMVRRFIRDGYLTEKDTYLWVNNSRRHSGICPESLHRFQQKYISVGKLLQRAGVTRPLLDRELSKLDIKPIIAERGISRVFHVSDVEEKQDYLATRGINL